MSTERNIIGALNEALNEGADRHWGEVEEASKPGSSYDRRLIVSLNNALATFTKALITSRADDPFFVGSPLDVLSKKFEPELRAFDTALYKVATGQK